jgi:hypothetical protein
MGNWRVLIAVVVVAGCILAAGWLAGASSGSSQWVPPAAVSAALRQAGVTLRIAKPVGPGWASTNQLYRGTGVRVVWVFAGTTGSHHSVIGPWYSNELGGSGSTQGVLVIELPSDASAAGYVTKIRPALAQPVVPGLRAYARLTCSYRNLVVIVQGLGRAATEATFARVTSALGTTAPRSATTTAISRSACNQPNRVRV